MVMDCFIAWTQPGHSPGPSLLILSVLTEAIKAGIAGGVMAGANISQSAGDSSPPGD